MKLLMLCSKLLLGFDMTLKLLVKAWCSNLILRVRNNIRYRILEVNIRYHHWLLTSCYSLRGILSLLLCGSYNFLIFRLVQIFWIRWVWSLLRISSWLYTKVWCLGNLIVKLYTCSNLVVSYAWVCHRKRNSSSRGLW